MPKRKATDTAAEETGAKGAATRTKKAATSSTSSKAKAPRATKATKAATAQEVSEANSLLSSCSYNPATNCAFSTLYATTTAGIPVDIMGNKNSTSKEPHTKSRGTKVEGVTGSTVRSTLKHGNTIGSKSAEPTAITLSLTSTPIPVVKKVFDPQQCYAWFNTYTGLDEDEDFGTDQIGPVGIAKLCEDIDVSLETVDMLVLAYHLEADTMPVFTKEEWAKGMQKLRVDSTSKLKAKMPELVRALKDPQHFKEFYRYIFMFAKDSEQKCMPLETACAMLQTVLKGRPHEQRFVEFLENKKPVKVINKDQWYNFLDFSESVAEDLSNYDGASSAWPVLLDDYVEWRNEGQS
ncbi:DCN1-like protein 5 [Mortierella claussenii]|nr:DCN1-like protein 5 [Mortierella claussenii]